MYCVLRLLVICCRSHLTSHSTRHTMTKDYLLSCLAVRGYKLLPLLFYYDTRMSSLSATHRFTRKLKKLMADKGEEPEDVSSCFLFVSLSLQELTFNYDFEKLVSSIFRPPRSGKVYDNGCWIIGTINCIRFVTFYKMFSPANASLIIFVLNESP